MAIQQLTQPIVNPIAAFDSTKEHEITLIVIGGAQVTGNRVVITNNKTGNVVYEKITATMKLAVTIPANTLSNNNYYNVVIYTIDNANNQSNPSTPVPFYCYSQPTLTITNIPATETIGNGTYGFQGNYLQSEGEQLNSYQFILYDSNKNILDRSDIIYYQSNSSLAYTFVGMDNDTSYYVELKGQTVNNTEITSGLMYFTVRYIQPATFAIVDLINDCENGYIQISSNIVAIDGKSNPEPPIYIDDKEVDLRDKDSWVKWDKGFNINNDFTMRVWGRDFNDYERIISLANKENTPDNPNKIEMKWMIADVLETLPSYTSVFGKNVAIKNGFKTDIKDLEVMGNSEQISKKPVDLGTGNYIKAETTRDMYLDIDVYGNSEQKSYEGYNRLDTTKSTTQTINGVTITINENSSITFNGTMTGVIWLELSNKNFNLPSGDYTWSLNSSYTLPSGDYTISVRTSSNVMKMNCNFNLNVKQQTLSEDIENGFVAVYIGTITTFNNLTIYPMLVSGTYTADTIPPYEPYTGGIPSPNPDYPSEIETVGSNVNELNIADVEEKEINGVKYSVKNGVLKLDGTATEGIDITLIRNVILKKGIYTHSTNYIQAGMFASFDNKNGLNGSNNITKNTFELTEDTTYSRYFVWINKGTVLNNVEQKLKLEKGSVATPWSPYRNG